MAEKEQAAKVVTLNAHAGVTEIPANVGRPDVPVLVHLVAPPNSERASIDLVALLDVSGSMAWRAKDPHWSRLALVQAAMELAMRRLGAADRLAIVPFNGGVVHRAATGLICMDQRGHSQALNAVLRLRAGGDTKFLPALDWAARLLAARSREEKADRPAFVFLLSDGQDGSGVVRRHVDVGGYPVHTFGMCQTCNPQVMLHVARETRGTYHPVDDTVKSLALALGSFVGGITSVVAVNAKVDFAVPDGVRITKIESGSYGSEWSKGTEGHVDVGVLYGKDEKKFVVHLSVQQLTDPTKGVDKQPLLTATGTYNKPSRREPDFMKQAEVTVKRTPPPPASGSDGQEDAAPPAPPATAVHIQQVVAVQIVEIHVAAVLQEVVKAHNKDDGGDAAPNPKLIAQELHDKWHSSKADEKLQHIHEDHVKTGDVHVTEMVKLLKEHGHVGVLYAHAWLASHATQQMATFAVSSVLVKHWFHSEYMALVAGDLAYHAASMAAPPAAAADDPCKCVDFDRIDHRLELWSRVKREVPEFFQPSEDAESHHLTAVIREASLDAINRAMHQDMYLAVVHASNLRRCYCAGKQSPSSSKPQHDLPTPKDDHH